MEMYLTPVALLLLLLTCSCTDARPQDLETSMLLAVAQMQQLMESGAAARNEHSVEVLGQKLAGQHHSALAMPCDLQLDVVAAAKRS